MSQRPFWCTSKKLSHQLLSFCTSIWLKYLYLSFIEFVLYVSVKYSQINKCVLDNFPIKRPRNNNESKTDQTIYPVRLFSRPKSFNACLRLFLSFQTKSRLMHLNLVNILLLSELSGFFLYAKTLLAYFQI